MFWWAEFKVVQFDCKVHWIDCSWLVHRSVIVRTPLLMYFGRRTPFHSKFILTNKLYCRSQFTYVVGGGLLLFWRTSVNEFSFLLKLPTLTVCRQSVQISTTPELLSTALNCRIYYQTSAHRLYQPDQSLTHFQLFPDWLATSTQRQDRSEAIFHKLLISFSHTIFHAI